MTARLPVAALAAALALGGGCHVAAPRFPALAAWDDPARPGPALEPDERELWNESEQAAGELVESEDHFEDAALVGYVESVVGRMAPTIAEGGPELRVLINRNVEDNASAAPDGWIVIALPLLASFDDEAQLAFVLGHEIVHVTKRHSLMARRYDALTASHVERMRLSRRSEAEADRGAIERMVAAGYDPREAEPALRHVADTSEEPPHTFAAWNSHDRLEDRLAVIRRAVQVAGSQARDRGEERFARALDGSRLTAAELELAAGRYERALALVKRHLARRPDDGPAHALRARIRAEQEPKARLSDAIGADLERAVELGPQDAGSLRALGLFLRDRGDADRSKAMLRRYLAARPDAFDRKLIERYLADPADPTAAPSD